MQEKDFFPQFNDPVAHAEKSLRFFNWFVDTLGIFLLWILTAIIRALVAPEAAMQANRTGSHGVWYLVAFIIFISYFSLLEWLTKGKTFGKLITGTRAVKADGSSLTFADAFKRGLFRAIPLEPLSGFLKKPWHDEWTGTMVIKEKGFLHRLYE